ncbi:MAG: glycosyltransferase [Rhodospirillales bacterium]|nr:glycosyltransferase [Rhodospirillales bacterium]
MPADPPAPAAVPAICHVYATFAVGGPQMRFAALANRFAERYRHLIVAMDGDTAARERLGPQVDADFPPVPIRKGATLENRSRFRAALRAWRPDLLVTCNWGSIEWAMADLPRLVPHIHIEDGFGPEEQAGQLRRRVLTRRAVLRWSTVVVPSRTLYRLATEVWRLPARRVRYIPNGIDLGRFASAAPERFPGEGLVIGTVAALRPEKNLSRLLRACRVVADRLPLRLVIVGAGPQRAALEALAAELGLGGQVIFAGHSPSPAGFYRGFDLFALSSDTEQMPLSVIEAMAAGLPVAATDVGDVREMVAAEGAPYVVPRDADALAGAILALAADPAARARIGAANRVRAAHEFDQETMFAAYAGLFAAATGAAGATGPASQARNA